MLAATDGFHVQWWVEIFLSISTSLTYFEHCSFPRHSIECSACTTVSFMQSWLFKFIDSLDASTNGFPIVTITSHMLVTCFLKVSECVGRACNTFPQTP